VEDIAEFEVKSELEFPITPEEFDDIKVVMPV
jgi:hypothetical protein